MKNSRQWIFCVVAFIISFVVCGIVFSSLVNNNVVSSQSSGVQFFADIYNGVGFKVSTPALTLEQLENAMNDGSRSKTLDCFAPKRKDTAENGSYAMKLFEQIGDNSNIDIQFKSLDIDDNGNIIAHTQIYGSALFISGESISVDFPMEEIKDRWYLTVNTTDADDFFNQFNY